MWFETVPVPTGPDVGLEGVPGWVPGDGSGSGKGSSAADGATTIVGAVPAGPMGDTIAGLSRGSRARSPVGNLNLRHARIFIVTVPCASAGMSRAGGLAMTPA